MDSRLGSCFPANIADLGNSRSFYNISNDLDSEIQDPFNCGNNYLEESNSEECDPNPFLSSTSDICDANCKIKQTKKQFCYPNIFRNNICEDCSDGDPRKCNFLLGKGFDSFLIKNCIQSCNFKFNGDIFIKP